jgi:succinate dehydrogenase/fumarate reductase flavoprotein subunit
MSCLPQHRVNYARFESFQILEKTKMADLTQLVDEIITTDILIIGSEGAGARAAIEAAGRGASVIATTKGIIGKSGATVTADADIDVDSRSCRELLGLPGDMNDSPERFMEDMIVEGEYLGDQNMIEIHCREAPLRTKELVDWGAKIDYLTQAPGHRYPRGVWIPGSEFARVLTKEIAKRNIRLIEHLMITDLLTNKGQVVGALGLDILHGKLIVFKTGAIILCTGGAMRIYPHTTAPDELTGDGLAMAYRAGAELTEMEFPMFLPYCLITPSAIDGVDFSYNLSAYVESYALNRLGQRYMSKWDPIRMERTTRDVNSIAAGIEILEGRGSPNGGTYLSLKHLPSNLIEYTADWLPQGLNRWRYGNFKMKEFIPDLSQYALETAPASHFWNGGVRINERCETSLVGLYAAGEGTASIHGANRVSGNALTMTQVWGPRAGEYAVKFVKSSSSPEIDPDQVAILRKRLLGGFERKEGSNPIDLRKRIRELAFTKVGVVRNEEGLDAAIAEISGLSEEAACARIRCKEQLFNLEWVEAIQNENMITVLEMVARSSRMRTESRGALYRTDYPKVNNRDWIKHILIRQANGKMVLSTEPVNLSIREPHREIRNYGLKE